MQINQEGVELIKKFEGLRLDAYLCPAGKLTIGYGHTGADVFSGQVLTKEEAEGLLRCDLKRLEDGVSTLVKVELNPNQFSALVSFAYNCGLRNLEKSTLLRKLNSGDFEGAAKEFLRWNKASNRALEGLTRRRQAEKELFERADIMSQNLA